MEKENLKQRIYITNDTVILRVLSWTDEHISCRMLLNKAYICLPYEELKYYHLADWVDGILLWKDYKKQEHTVDELLNALEDLLFFKTYLEPIEIKNDLNSWLMSIWV